MEKELHILQEKLKAQNQSLPIPSYTWKRIDHNLVLVDFNAAADQFTDGAVREFMGSTAAEMYGVNADILKDMQRCLLEKRVIRREMPYTTRDGGNSYYMGVTCAFVPPDMVMVHTEDITERKRTEHDLRQAEARYRTLVEQIPAVTYVASLEGPMKILYVSPQITQYGVTQSDFIAHPETWYSQLHPEDRARVIALMNRSRSSGTPFSCEYRLVSRRSGRTVWFQDEARPVLDGGQTRLWQGIIYDITERKRSEEALRQAEARYRGLFENALEGIFQTTVKGRFQTANQAMAQMLGYGSPEELLEAVEGFPQVFANPHRWSKLLRMVQKYGFVTDFEVRAHRRDGSLTWVSLSVRGSRGVDRELRALDGLMIDIGDRKRAEEALRSMSLVDDLTGLYNRRGFMTLARQELRRAHRTRSTALTIFVDLDDMKWINDNLGHVAGDAALTAVGEVLKQTFRESDIIARIGGDEFVVFALEMPDASAEVLVDRLNQNLADYNATAGGNVHLSLSVGVSHYDPERPQSIEELLNQADRLMYEEKKRKQNRQDPARRGGASE